MRLEMLQWLISLAILICLPLTFGHSTAPWKVVADDRFSSSDNKSRSTGGKSAAVVNTQEEDGDYAKALEVIARFSKGDRALLWKMLKSDANPSVRSYLIHQLAPNNIPVEVLIDRLRTTRDDAEKGALILSLSEYSQRQLSASVRNSVVPLLLQMYRDDPDSGVHASVEWLFKYLSEGKNRQRVDWMQRAEVESIERESTRKVSQSIRWYINSADHTMIVIRKPQTFWMGSPTDEPLRSSDEVLHRVHIPRDFAIANKEVTVEQFQRFLRENPDIKAKWESEVTERFRNILQFTSDPRNPQAAISWYEAAAYCNWLSKLDGIPRDQWCYPELIGPGMQLPSDYLHRTGYRLPTEAEWEFAARAGTSTAHFFGASTSLLRRYAWFQGNTNSERAWPVGQLKPNLLGLFDIYGNVWEWLQDRRVDYPTERSKITEDDEDSVLVISNEVARTRRGGSFTYDVETTRSAHRGATTYYPNQRRDSVGFRVARTIRLPDK